MRTIPLLLLGLLLVACGSEAAPRTAGPSPTTSPSPSPTRPAPDGHDRVVPADFPLIDRYPSDEGVEGPQYGLERPSRTRPPLDLAPCARAVPLPAHTDLVRAGWDNVEDYRERQLVTFASAPEAAAYVERIAQAYRDCPRHPDEQGATVHRVAPTELGDNGVVVSTRFETPEGWPAVGLVTLHAVRVGSAVLLASTSTEGGAGPDPEADAADQVVRDSAAIAGVVRAMRRLSAVPRRTTAPGEHVAGGRRTDWSIRGSA